MTAGPRTGITSRIEAKSGEVKYRWRLELEAGSLMSSRWAYNGRACCLNEEGKTFVVAAGEKLEVLAVNLLDEMAQAAPAIVGERRWRTESRLYSIRGRWWRAGETRRSAGGIMEPCRFRRAVRWLSFWLAVRRPL